MKKIGVLCLLVMGAFQLFAQQNLSWDVQLLKGQDREVVPYSQIITVENGQEWNIFITPASNCFCYVFSQNAQRKIYVLHDQAVKGKTNISLNLFPENTPENATLYIIISQTRQTKLEGLIKSYKSDSSSQKIANNLRGEIAALQDMASELGEPSILLVASGGTTRGTAHDYVTRFSGKKIYVNTITIRTAQAKP